jgi:hypothetical protein
MLFDLRGAGRRRTVQGIYLALAILMGGGLVLFGVGGNVGGGLLDAVKGNGSGGSGSNTFEKRVQQLEQRVRVNPQNAAAWVALAQARYQLTNTGADYDQSTSTFTAKGKQDLRSVAQAWNRYLALNPAKPDANVASLMVQAFGPAGLNQPDDTVAAMEIVVDSRPPSSALYAQLAQYAYLAGQTRKGDLSSQKAVSLAPKAQRAALKQQLDQIKTQSAASAAQGATGTAPPTATTG